MASFSFCLIWSTSCSSYLILLSFWVDRNTASPFSCSIWLNLALRSWVWPSMDSFIWINYMWRELFSLIIRSFSRRRGSYYNEMSIRLLLTFWESLALTCICSVSLIFFSLLNPSVAFSMSFNNFSANAALSGAERKILVKCQTKEFCPIEIEISWIIEGKEHNWVYLQSGWQ